MSDRAAFDTFVDKYDLRGVEHLAVVVNELHMRKEMRQLRDKQRDVGGLQGQVARLERKVNLLQSSVE